MPFDREIQIKTTITDDWGGSHKVVLDLEALSTVEDWSLGISLNDDYRIDQIYGADLTTEAGKTYILGKDWNRSLDPGETTEIVLIIDEGNSGNLAPILPRLFHPKSTDDSLAQSSDTDLILEFDRLEVENREDRMQIQSTITDDWGGSHKVVLDLEALSTVEDWSLGIFLNDDYRIDQIYGADLTTDGGKTYISGKDWNRSLDPGQKTEIVLIIDEGNSSNFAPVLPQLFYPDYTADSGLSFNSQIVEDWNGGYKLEVDLTATTEVVDWQADFYLPYNIKEFYGVDLIDRGNGNYTIDGQDYWKDLQSGQTIKAIFIVEDNGKSAIAPELASALVAVQPQNNTNSTINYSAFAQTTGRDEDIVAEPEGEGRIISVDDDFEGDLASAIAAANQGDVVQLGKNTYYTDGITLDKDITIDGREGSIINGNGISSIIRITPQATGATIQDVEISNGNNGIHSYGASNLTLQNLEVNNIGIDRTIRNGLNNTGIILNHADGVRLLNSSISNVGRKGVGIGDTDGAMVSGLLVEDVNLEAQHAQSYDAAGIKFFNTNDVKIEDSYFSNINANSIWNDTTNMTTIEGNVVENVGEDFLAPSFNNNVNISGIYNEKSSNSVVENNEATAVGEFLAFNATEFSTSSMREENNNFSNYEVDTEDFWINESAEMLIATTKNPDEVNFSLFAEEYFALANIG